MLEADNILLEQVDPAGNVTRQAYQDHINDLALHNGLLDKLNNTLRNLHLKLDGKSIWDDVSLNRMLWKNIGVRRKIRYWGTRTAISDRNI